MKKGKKVSRQGIPKSVRNNAPKAAIQKRQEEKRTLIILLSLYIASVLLRYAMSYETLNMPTVYIDEGLYINIARSLFHDGQVMYRDQPVSYVYLLYSIALLPLFLLPSSVSIYRAVQFYNAMLISSSVLPAYFLGRKIQLPRNRSVILAVFTLLIPEFSLSSYLTAESLYYPLMIWLFVLAAAICNVEDGKKIAGTYLAFGVLSGILYFAKPICIIFPLCFLVVDFITNLHEKEPRKAGCSFCTIVVTGMIVAMGHIAYNHLFGATTVLNLYEKQLSETDMSSIPIMIQATFYHIIALVFSCGGAFIVLPFAWRKSFSKNQRKLMNAGIVGILASVIGVAIMVVPYQYTGSGLTCPVHMRYLAFFFPLLMAFFLSPELPAKKMGKGTALLLSLITACTVFPSAFRFFSQQAGTFDAPSLNAFNSERIAPGIGILLVVLSVFAVAYIIFASVKTGWKEKMRIISCILLVAFFVINGCCSYAARRTDKKVYELEATKLSQIIENEPDVLIVTTNRYDDFRTFHIDSHLRKPVQMVVMNDFLLNCTRTAGVYQPWEPLVQAPNTFNNATVETDTLVFDLTTSDYVEFTDNVSTIQVGHYLIAKITPEKPLLKTAIASMDGFTLNHQDLGSLLVFDPDILARGFINLDLDMRSKNSIPCTVTFSCCGESAEVTVTETAQSYSVTLPVKECEYFHFTIACSDDVIIGGYQTS